MKIKELNTIGIGLRDLGDLPLKGRLKFKVARNIKIAEDILVDAMEAASTDKDSDEVMNTEIDVKLLHFKEEELEPLEINSKVIYMLLPIIDDASDEEIEGTLYV